jgi:hypothetical protein
MVGYLIHVRSINSDAFIQFKMTVLERKKPKDFFLFLHNFSVHHSNIIAQFLVDKWIEAILDVSKFPRVQTQRVIVCCRPEEPLPQGSITPH